MLGSIPVLQILAVSVAIRVGNGTAMTTLKGAGQHRMLALVNMATALANVGLSIAFVRRWGLVGVAVGTLLPILLNALLFVYPAACRRVNLSLPSALARTVLPAVWPALVVAAALTVTREIAPVTLASVATQALAAGLLYLTLFYLAISKQDRALYTAKVFELMGRRLAIAAS